MCHVCDDGRDQTICGCTAGIQKSLLLLIVDSESSRGSDKNGQTTWGEEDIKGACVGGREKRKSCVGGKEEAGEDREAV